MTAGRGSMSKNVLNVGGNSKAIAIPRHFEGWTHDLLDIDPRGRPDILCDARKLTTLAPNLHDAVYCSHNLEHYFAHEVPKVLRGFHHVLKPRWFRRNSRARRCAAHAHDGKWISISWM
jgi:hypothetical protein